MVTKRTGTRKLKKKKQTLVQETKEVPLSYLNLYYKNPRRGNVKKIAESLEYSGQYKPIVVNRGTHTGRENEVLAGNHTVLGARQLDWHSILVSFVDVDEEDANRIVVADNKTAQLGGFDEELLGEILSTLPDVAGTGYEQEEMDELVKSATAAAADAADAAIDELQTSGAFDTDTEDTTPSLNPYNYSLPAEDDDDNETEDNEDDEPGVYTKDGRFVPEAEPESSATDELSSKPSTLYGVNDLLMDLPEEKSFYTGPLELPKLRKDMYVMPEDLPEKLKTWAGSATRDDQPDDQWWHYPWGGDTTKGLKNLDQVIISFYSWDDAFANWFWTPNKYAAKLLNSGIRMAITPDYSMWDTQSTFLNLFAMYRNQYVARYLQEVGVKTIQALDPPYNSREFIEKYMFKYVPNDQKVYAQGFTVWNQKRVEETGQEKNIIEQEKLLLDHYQPEVMLVYGVRTGLRWYEERIASMYPEMKLIKLDFRMDLLNDWRKKENGGTTRKHTL